MPGRQGGEPWLKKISVMKLVDWHVDGSDRHSHCQQESGTGWEGAQQQELGIQAPKGRIDAIGFAILSPESFCASAVDGLVFSTVDNHMSLTRSSCIGGRINERFAIDDT